MNRLARARMPGFSCAGSTTWRGRPKEIAVGIRSLSAGTSSISSPKRTGPSSSGERGKAMKKWIGFLLCATCMGAATHEIFPDHHSRVFSAHEQPVLRIRSGDTVITKTWDSGGQDQTGKRHLQH